MKKAVNNIVGRITKENKKKNIETKNNLRLMLRKMDFNSFKDACYEILAEEMD